MSTINGAGAKPPVLPKLKDIDFLDFTLEMADWYYRTSDSDIIDMHDIDGNVSVIEITEFHNDTMNTKSFTIGKKIKNTIKYKFLYYLNEIGY